MLHCKRLVTLLQRRKDTIVIPPLKLGDSSPPSPAPLLLRKMKGSAFQISGPALRDFELVADVDSQIMMMPSLFKYFTIVGGGLLGLPIAGQAAMSPGG